METSKAKIETENESIVTECARLCVCMELFHAFQFDDNPNVLSPICSLPLFVGVGVGQIQISAQSHLMVTRIKHNRNGRLFTA